MMICNECIFNSMNNKHKGIINKIRKPYCMKCLCNLKAKTMCDICECPINKWDASININDL